MSAGVNESRRRCPIVGMIHLVTPARSETYVPGRTIRWRCSSHRSVQRLTEIVALVWKAGPSAANSCCVSASRARAAAAVRAFRVIRRRVPRFVHPASTEATHWPREFRYTDPVPLLRCLLRGIAQFLYRRRHPTTPHSRVAIGVADGYRETDPTTWST